MRKLIPVAILALAALACVRSQPDIIVITATFAPPTPPTIALSLPTFSPTQTASATQDNGAAANTSAEQTRVYVVRPGDTLTGIAAANGISLSSLLELNPMQNPNLVEVGQVIQLPPLPNEVGSSLPIISDQLVVRSPASRGFDVAEFVSRQPGYIRTATDLVGTELLTAAQIVNRVSLEYSVDARLLLALLEYRSGWLSNPEPSETEQVYPMRIGASPLGFDRNGLYRQLTWGADRLNSGYYNWKQGTRRTLELADGRRLLLDTRLNAGTAAVQYLFSLTDNFGEWSRGVGTDGFIQIYNRYFGDSLSGFNESVIPSDLVQPELALPFERGQIWYYTGGPHGGWGSGSAWAAIDFAPPDDLANVTSACYISQYFVTAVAPGIIARTDTGVVVLDLDGDGDESTGWSILYLHLADADRITAGTRVDTGARIGRPSCDGGFSNGTHVHIARRYNGEWIPADCSACAGDYQPPTFNLGGWSVVGLPAQEYQGFLARDGQRRIAEQGRGVADNQVGW